MTKEEIGAMLKATRLKSGKTQKEVAKLLGKTQQVIGHWETGYAQPDANTLFTLCEIYGTTVDEVFGFAKTPTSLLDKQEISILWKYRKLDPPAKGIVESLMDAEILRIESMKDKEEKIRKLEASENQPETETPKEICVPYYGRNAAAGKAVGSFSDLMQGTMTIPDTPSNRKADYVIGISGESMEPTFFDGDLVLVKNASGISKGEIGIFQKDNEIYIKEAGDDCLISHNPKYPPMKTCDRVILLGKVVGKIEK